MPNFIKCTWRRNIRIGWGRDYYNCYRNNERLASMDKLGYVLRASDQRARAFPPLSLERTNTCM